MADNDKLKKMMEDAQSSENSDKVSKTIANSVSPKKKKWPWFAGGVAVLLLGVGIAVVSPKFSNTQDLDKTSTATNSDGTASKSLKKGQQSIADAMASVKTPIHLEKWQAQSYLAQSKEKAGSSANTAFKDGLDKWIEEDNNVDSLTASGFASTEAGFTDDTTKATNSDGTINTKFSFLTTENINYAYSSAVNRLLNPVFGDWNLAQYAENKPASQSSLIALQDMFTEDWWTANIKEGQDYTKLPIYADWKADNYGGMSFYDKKTLARWYGKPTNETVDYNANADGTFKNFVATVNVVYSAFDKDKNVITKNGVLKFTLVQNPTKEDNPQLRLLVSDASLTMD